MADQEKNQTHYARLLILYRRVIPNDRRPLSEGPV